MRSWKTHTRTLLCGAYKYSGAMRLHEAVARCAGQQFMTILVFHRVTDAIPEDALTVSTARFWTMCKMLRNSCRVVPLADVVDVVRSGKPMPPRTVAVTFDDSYQDTLPAARTLAELGLPATFFIPTGFVGTDRIYPWDRGLPRLPHLTWDNVREIARLGHEIGSHSVTHADLGTVDLEQARVELVVSRTTLQEEIGQPVRWFAYPFGGPHHLRPEYVPLIQETGYDGGFSAHGGFVEPGVDSRILPREAAPSFRSVLHLEMFLAGCLHWLYKLKKRRGWKKQPPVSHGEGTNGSCAPRAMLRPLADVNPP